jgi:hypothetical protein
VLRVTDVSAQGGRTAMEGPDYWTRWAKRRLSRRRLLTGAAGAGAGLAALSLVGCGGGEEKGPTGTAAPAGTPGTPSATSRVLKKWC